MLLAITLLLASMVVAGCTSEEHENAEITAPPAILDVQLEDGSVEQLVLPLDTGLVVGIARDEAGNPVADARVMLKGTQHEASSSSTGRFIIEGVQTGQYDFQITHESFLTGHAQIDVRDALVTRIQVTMVDVVEEGSGGHAMESGHARAGAIPVTLADAISPAVTVSASLVIGLLFGPILLLRPRQTSHLVAAARNALAHHQPREADRLARKATARDPTCTDAWFILGAALIHRGDCQQAIAVLEDASKTYDPKVAGIAFLLTLANQRLGKPDEARRWLPLVARDDDYWDALEHDPSTAFKSLLAGSKPKRPADPAYA